MTERFLPLDPAAATTLVHGKDIGTAAAELATGYWRELRPDLGNWVAEDEDLVTVPLRTIPAGDPGHHRPGRVRADSTTVSACR
jgi:hypothetical protein